MNEFRATRIWPFNPKAMDHKTRPSDVYISNFVNILNDDVFDGTIDEISNGEKWNWHTTNEHKNYSRLCRNRISIVD
jgi:hypothetical protein